MKLNFLTYFPPICVFVLKGGRLDHGQRDTQAVRWVYLYKKKKKSQWGSKVEDGPNFVGPSLAAMVSNGAYGPDENLIFVAQSEGII